MRKINQIVMEDSSSSKPFVPVDTLTIVIEPEVGGIYTFAPISDVSSWVVRWGDGTKSTGERSHTYTSGKDRYTIQISALDPTSQGWLRAFRANGKVHKASGFMKASMVMDLSLGRDNMMSKWFLGNKTITDISGLTLPIVTTIIGDGWFSDMFNNCFFLQNIPDSFHLDPRMHFPSVFGVGFCASMFLDCISLKTGVINFFNGIQFTQEELDMDGVFKSTFQGCEQLTETISATTISQLAISPTTSNTCFLGANPTAIADCPQKWNTPF